MHGAMKGDAGAAKNADVPLLSRELSWLQFNARVLAQAADRGIPLLARLKFLGIFTSNLDEFVMKRVGGLKRQILAGVVTANPQGLTPKQQLRAIREALMPLLRLQSDIYRSDILPELALQGIELLKWSELDSAEKCFTAQHFMSKIFPILTPLAVDAGHPFPFISNLSTSLGVTLAHPEGGEPLFARVKIGGPAAQWLPTNGEPAKEGYRFVSLHDLVIQHLAELFPGMQVLATTLFRVTRNADLEVLADDEADDLLEIIEEELRQRRFAEVIRFEHGPNPDPWILSFLMQELQLSEDDMYELPGELDYAALAPVCALELPALRFAPYTPVTPPALVEDASMFSAIRHRNILVHHPYESFSSSVERFVREAAEDEKVRALKMTVYRVGDQTPIIPLLIRAANLGKQVVCLVELMARFEEERNIQFAQKLEEAGVHVVYGVPGLKTHAKTLLAVREEGDGLRCYAHIGTGNYNTETAALYTDLGFFTCAPRYTQELLHLFNFLTGRSRKENYEKLLIAPLTMEQGFLGLIENEIQHARRGESARIILKMNSLEDVHMISKLYEASQAGVEIDLIVRGICCLRPGMPGLSERIRVCSVIGRFLEHSRVFYFGGGSSDPLEGTYYISSADWMERNLHRRLEIATPLEERWARERCWQLLQTMLGDRVRGWEMLSDGRYVRRSGAAAGEGGTHERLMELARKSVRILAE